MLAGKYKKSGFHRGQLIFHRRAKQTLCLKCRDSVTYVVTLAKIQSASEASHHLTLMDSCQTFYSYIFVFV